MKALQFLPQRVNVSGRWRAAAVWEGESLPAEQLENYLRTTCGLDRHTTDAVVKAVRSFVLEQLTAGNAVNLFDLVRLFPRLQVQLPSVATAAEAEEVARRVRPCDVDYRVGCQPLLATHRLLLSHLRRQHLARRRPGQGTD